ncbi:MULTISPECIES: hypothetical protein [Pseudoalteromonas]|uniref:hypothetical protein n=1 Tax=Pseudoalteromonas TaxID=53246 RepID=UPI001583BF2C|nr:MULTISPECIES: hypothetical protein [Pseudoalteromonas]MDI4654575.1 hypothetical protein [Pseudoalteromonas shioyasakiensis]NUJ40156.1 hypothetical protein [Pseudoalteromonas sp. 0303]
MNTLSIFKQPDNNDFFMAAFNEEEALNLAHKGSYADAINEALCVWGLDVDSVIVEVDAEITFNYDYGDYGSHDGFFNAVVLMGDEAYHFQCCTDENGEVDFDDCGYMEGLCGDCNDKLAAVVGWDGVFSLLKRAYEEYK